MVPFSFKLPDNIPGTYHMKTVDNSGKEHTYQVCYTVEMFIDTDGASGMDDVRECFTREHEFEIREFLFTDDEVEADVEKQQIENKVKTLFKT